MAKKGNAYFGWHWIVSLILAIIPLTNIIFGIITRITKKNLIGAVLNFFACFYFYFVDLITIIFYRDILVVTAKF